MISSGQTLDEAKRDAKGYNRYYDSAVNVNGKQYLICSQWIENLHKDKVETWIIDKMADIVAMIAAGIPTGDEFNVREILWDYWPHIDWSVRKRIGKTYKLIIKDDPSVECVSENTHGKIYRKVK